MKISGKMFVYSGVIFCLLFQTCSENSMSSKSGSDWKTVGDDAVSEGVASFIDITVDTDGFPIIAYRDEENNGGITVKKYDGSSWNLLGNKNISGNDAYYINIEMAGNIPVIAFRDMGSNSIEGRLSVMQFYQGSWTFLGKRGITENQVIEDNQSVGWGYDNVLLTAVDESTIYVGCKTQSSGFIFQWDGEKWNTISAGLPVVYTSEHDLYASSINSLFYVFNEGINGKVKKWDGSQWINVGSDEGLITVQGGGDYSIKVFNDIPYVAYRAIDSTIDDSQTQSHFDKAVVKKFTGGVWQLVGDSSKSDPFSISERTASEISLSTGNNGDLFICYSDWSGKAGTTAHRFNGTKWQQLGEKDFSVEGAHYIKMAVYGSKPFVAYQDEINRQAVVKVYDP